MENKKVYISKSKMGTYERCPYSYKFAYIDKIRGGNQYTDIGTNVHDFIEEVFKVVKPNIETEKLDNISSLKLSPNLNYKKNVLLLEQNRWKNICKLGLGKINSRKLFYPFICEEFIEDKNNLIRGIVDRVHKCHKGDAFAPDIEKFPQFKDNDLVIVENKTGLYSRNKAQSYEEELLWYRMMIKAQKGIDIRWGAIYFPIGNNIHTIDLDEHKFNQEFLIERIDDVRSCIKQEIFLPIPSKYNCTNCFYRERCEFKK